MHFVSATLSLRHIERKAARRDKVQAEIELRRGQSEIYILPEIIYTSESENEAAQAAPSRSDGALFSESSSPRSHQSSVPDVDPEFVRQFGELLVNRKEEMTLESLPEASELAAEIEKVTEKMGELSATADGVFETMARLLGKSDEFQRLADEKQRRAQLEEGRSAVSPVEKKQEFIQRQERLKQRQRKRDKKRDQGMEL